MHQPAKKTLKVLARKPPAGIDPADWFPVTVPVEWTLIDADSYDDYPAHMPGVDVYVGTDLTPEMGAAADSLKAIFIPAAGFDRINPDAVPDGCVVTNAYEHEAPIAEWVMACAVALDHELFKSERTFRSGSWDMWPAYHGGFRELFGRTFGVIGFGAIGRRVAKLALAYDMRVIAAGRRTETASEAQAMGVEYGTGRAALERVLRESDFVLVSTPLIPETRGLVGENELSLMRPTAYLFNPARGHIVDEKALYEALRDRRIAGAAVDTWYAYPSGRGDTPRPSQFPFWELDNIIMTPHHSGATGGTRERRARIVAANIDRLHRGEPLLNIVPSLSRV